MFNNSGFKKILLSIGTRAMLLIGVSIALLALFAYSILRLGPMAPVPVTVIKVENRAISPALFGIGTVGARYTYSIGPTAAGRVALLEVDVGDHVNAGQVLGRMDPVDLNDKIAAQQAALQGAQASILATEAQVRDTAARKAFAETQVRRYQQLLQAHTTSEEVLATQQQSLQAAMAAWDAANANLDAARQARNNSRANLEALIAQRANLNLIAPVAGIVTARNINPGTTVVAGSPVVEMVDPKSMWVNVRFDQLSSTGLHAGLPVRVMLRSRNRQFLVGHVLWIDPLADSVTEETRAKVVFDQIPQPLPPLGELAEATVSLPVQAETPVVPNASIQRIDGRTGVWLIENSGLRFAPVKLGVGDLDGRIQVLDGLKAGEKIVEYSQRTLTSHSHIQIVQRMPGVMQ